LSASFVAIDVETANADLSSICQIGIATFTNGQATSEWQSLINPEDEFDSINVSIHGIDESSVQGAPRFSDVAGDVTTRLTNQVIVSHMAFDRVALSRAQEKYGLPPIDCRWLDTARVCRRTWSQFSRRGYGLAAVAAHCGIEFHHHDAAEDARTAGEILLRAISETGFDLEDWVTRANRPIDSEGSRPVRDGNPDGDLFGEVLVFTGSLSMPRREAADLAAAAGCDVTGSVSAAVSILVVGDHDVRRLAGHQKSSKHRRAEELIKKGHSIRILSERDFKTLVGFARPTRSVA
jgi:DNA polymerase-3 subunit epsilon